jgi:hypothetical protein
MSVDQMSVDQMSVDQISVDQMSVDNAGSPNDSHRCQLNIASTKCRSAKWFSTKTHGTIHN